MATPRKGAAPSPTHHSEKVTPSSAFAAASALPFSTTSSSAMITPINVSGTGEGEKGSSVQVVVRMRPPSTKETANGDTLVVGVYPQHSEVRVNTAYKKSGAIAPGQGGMSAPTSTKSSDTKTYTFDQTYGATSTQEEVYMQAVKPLVDEVLGGFNCTVFAYGQTGTGKTHTMEGALTTSVTEQSGVIPRSIHTIFDQLSEGKYEDYSVKVSFLELYNEELSDLLAESEEVQNTASMSTSVKPGSEDNEKKELRIFEDVTGKKGMLVHNLEEVLVTNASQVFTLLQKANKKRKVAATNLNERSSRSHYVFQITVASKEYVDGEDVIKSGKLYLVDLAGSECIGKSGATEKRAKEAGKINQSLLTLGRVINALVDRSSFVPYRDSKLTRLLQESLGGRAKTVIIATVSPSAAAFDETLSTLDYAHRAKSIKNKPQVNQKMTKHAYMKELLLEIASLKRDNEVLRTKNGIIVAPEKWERLQADMTGRSMQIDELLFKIKNQQTQMETLQMNLQEKEAALVSMTQIRDELQVSLNDTLALLDSTRMILAETRANLISTQTLLIQYQRALYERNIELENTRAIVKARSETEAELTQQACGVITTLQTTIAQKDLLHEKITRKQTVEEKNNALTKSYALEAEEKLNSLRKEERKMEDLVVRGGDITSQTITQATSQLTTQYTTAEQLNNQFHRTYSTANQTAMDKTVKASEKIVQEVKQHAEEAERYHLTVEEKLKDFSNTSDASFTVNTKSLDAIQSTTMKTIQVSERDLTSLQSTTKQFITRKLDSEVKELAGEQEKGSEMKVKESSELLNKLTDFTAAHTQRLHTDNETLRSKIQTMQSDMLTQIQSLQSQFMFAVNKMLDESEMKQVNEFEKNVGEMKKKIERTIEVEKMGQEKTQSRITSIETSSGAFATEIDSLTTSSLQHAQEGMKEIKTGYTELNQKRREQKDGEEQQIKVIQQLNTERKKQVASNSTAMKNDLTSYSTTISSSLDTLSSSCSTHLDSVSSWIETTQRQSDASLTQVKENVDTIIQTVKQHLPSFDSSVTNMSSRLSDYTSSLHRDIPLGTTPLKQTISYTQRTALVMTEEEQEIIRKFRMENPVQKLQFVGVLKMEGVEDVTNAGADSVNTTLSTTVTDEFPLLSSSLKSPLTLNTSSRSSSSASSTPSHIDVLPNEASTPLAQDEDEETENLKPVQQQQQQAQAPTPTSASEVSTEKPTATKRQTSRIAAPTTKANATTATSRPVTRGRFGYAAPQ